MSDPRIEQMAQDLLKSLGTRRSFEPDFTKLNDSTQRVVTDMVADLRNKYAKGATPVAKKIRIRKDPEGKTQEIEFTLEQAATMALIGAGITFFAWKMGIQTLKVVGDYKAQSAYAKATKARIKTRGA